LENTQQSTLLRLAQEGISVYSPHTAVDAAVGGVNDWLADVVAGSFTGSYVSSHPIVEIQSANHNREEPTKHKREVITAVKDAPDGFEGAGYGRIVRFTEPQSLGVLVSRITEGLGGLNGVSVATPQNVPASEKGKIQISSVGICAGSGGSMLGGLDVDLLFTGELSHHEALATIEQGRSVVTAFHSNTERHFQRGAMKNQLTRALASELPGATPGSDFHIATSQVDADPYTIVPSGQMKW
jgi:putative NIF3 family GTP cyclohydrolase 1 type 2